MKQFLPAPQPLAKSSPKGETDRQPLLFNPRSWLGPVCLSIGSLHFKDLIHKGGSLQLLLVLPSTARGREVSTFSRECFFFSLSFSVSLCHLAIVVSLHRSKGHICSHREGSLFLLPLGREYVALGTNVTSFILHFSAYPPMLADAMSCSFIWIFFGLNSLRNLVVLNGLIKLTRFVCTIWLGTQIYLVTYHYFTVLYYQSSLCWSSSQI